MVLAERAQQPKTRPPVETGRSEAGIAVGAGWGSAYTRPSPHDELREGIRAVVRSRNGGYLTEEQVDELLSAMLAAYVGTLIERQVSGYLEQGFSQMLSRQFEDWA